MGLARGSAAGWRGRVRSGRVAAPLLAVIAIGGLSGCADISQKFAVTASQMPGIGEPTNLPARPAETAAYPAVHAMPPPRNDVMLTEFERQKLEEDLATARDRQLTKVGLPPKPKATKEKSQEQMDEAREMTRQRQIKREQEEAAQAPPPETPPPDQPLGPVTSQASIY